MFNLTGHFPVHIPTKGQVWAAYACADNALVNRPFREPQSGGGGYEASVEWCSGEIRNTKRKYQPDHCTLSEFYFHKFCLIIVILSKPKPSKVIIAWNLSTKFVACTLLIFPQACYISSPSHLFLINWLILTLISKSLEHLLWCPTFFCYFFRRLKHSALHFP
jgi:hypothetical protein